MAIIGSRYLTTWLDQRRAGNGVMAHKIHELDETGIVGGLCNGLVQSKIGGACGLALRDTVSYGPMPLDNGLLLRRRAAGGGERCGFDLHRSAQFEQFDDR